MNYANTDYDSNKPEEALDGSDLIAMGVNDTETFTCPDCKSHSCKIYMIDGDDHRMHEEICCNGCGSTFTD